MNSLKAANVPEQNATTTKQTIGIWTFECPDIECGAVFSYRRISCGRFVLPDFCPTCGGSMAISLDMIRECYTESLLDQRQLTGQQPLLLLG